MTTPAQLPLPAHEALPQLRRDKSDNILLIIGLVCAFIAALAPTLVVPAFHQIFDSIGASTPPLTSFILNYHLWLWVLPVLVIAVRLFWPNQQKRLLASCLVGAIGLILVIPILILALYLPIFKFGSVV